MDVINTSGRRKTSIARVYMKKGSGAIVVNNKDYKTYFPSELLQFKITQPFAVINGDHKVYDIKVNVDGGGYNGQAEAIRLAIAKALVEVDATSKSELRAHGLITRDPRMVERKKFGQKKARKRFQFSKR
jgi:small subunit ribosomal protein S9